MEIGNPREVTPLALPAQAKALRLAFGGWALPVDRLLSSSIEAFSKTICTKLKHRIRQALFAGAI
jgi:hypothetical protein